MPRLNLNDWSRTGLVGDRGCRSACDKDKDKGKDKDKDEDENKDKGDGSDQDNDGRSGRTIEAPDGGTRRKEHPHRWGRVVATHR